MRLRLTVEAEEDLISIYVYGASIFGTKQAEHYYAELQAKLELIAQRPLIAREHKEFRPPVRIHPHRSHLIIYTAGDEGVLVVRVLGNQQDWTRLFSDL